MGKAAVVFWSGTGNTEAMAKAVAKGAQADLFEADAFDASKVNEYDGIAFGCPSMGAEELEDTVFEPVYAACKPSLAGKNVALFGSYGWGDGEWMRSWEADVKAAGANIVCESVICQEAPDAEAESACEALGRAVAGV